jgi:hypothetical protein
VLILIDEDELSERDWMRAAAHGGGFDFLPAPGEDIYTLEDGTPLQIRKEARHAIAERLPRLSATGVAHETGDDQA